MKKYITNTLLFTLLSVTSIAPVQTETAAAEKELIRDAIIEELKPSTGELIISPLIGAIAVPLLVNSVHQAVIGTGSFILQMNRNEHRYHYDDDENKKRVFNRSVAEGTALSSLIAAVVNNIIGKYLMKSSNQATQDLINEAVRADANQELIDRLKKKVKNKRRLSLGFYGGGISQALTTLAALAVRRRNKEVPFTPPPRTMEYDEY